MHHLVQRGKVRSQVINVPKGLPELISDITREVLRCQPTTECLCQFIIDYLNSLIDTRHKAKIAKSLIDIALRNVDEAISNMCICDIPKRKADYMCQAMEECFRRFLAQRRCEKSKNKEVIKFNELDMLDELVQKCKFTDAELKISKPVIEAAYQTFVNAYMTAKDNSEGAYSLYQYFREREILREEKHLKEESAVKIQSHFRGFLVRKSLFMDKPMQMEYDKMQMVEAAIKIQKFFRRHLKSIYTGEENKNVMEDGEEMETQDSCSPSSNLSLTAHAAADSTFIENYDINKIHDDQDENIEITADKQANTVIEDEKSN